MTETVYDRVVLLLQDELEKAHKLGTEGGPSPGRDEAARAVWKLLSIASETRP